MKVVPTSLSLTFIYSCAPPPITLFSTHVFSLHGSTLAYANSTTVPPSDIILSNSGNLTDLWTTNP